MTKRKKNNILTDWKHWLGWIITTVIIISVFHFLNVHLHKTWWYVVVLLGVIVGVDFIKHKINLQ